jgi:hypothetical protein
MILSRAAVWRDRTEDPGRHLLAGLNRLGDVLVDHGGVGDGDRSLSDSAGAAGPAVKIIAAIVVAAMIVMASVAGYHIIMKMQSYLTWITGA